VADGVLGREASRGVRQDRVSLGVDEVQKAAILLVVQALTAHGDGDHLTPRRVERLLHQLVRRVFARADEQT
jgi:hypothetical protein